MKWVRNFFFMIQIGAYLASNDNAESFNEYGYLGLYKLLELLTIPFMGATAPQIGNVLGELIGYHGFLLIGLLFHYFYKKGLHSVDEIASH